MSPVSTYQGVQTALFAGNRSKRGCYFTMNRLLGGGAAGSRRWRGRSGVDASGAAAGWGADWTEDSGRLVRRTIGDRGAPERLSETDPRTDGPAHCCISSSERSDQRIGITGQATCTRSS